VDLIDIQLVENTAEVPEIEVQNAEPSLTDPIPAWTPPAQTEEPLQPEDVIFITSEEAPVPPSAYREYLAKNIKYPAMAIQGNIQGTVYVTFVVEKDGSIANVRVLRGIGGGCDEEAVRVVQNMGNWKPGRQQGTPVRVQFSMPIKFTLSN
jgi:protein TonB